MLLEDKRLKSRTLYTAAGQSFKLKECCDDVGFEKGFGHYRALGGKRRAPQFRRVEIADVGMQCVWEQDPNIYKIIIKFSCSKVREILQTRHYEHKSGVPCRKQDASRYYLLTSGQWPFFLHHSPSLLFFQCLELSRIKVDSSLFILSSNIGSL